MDSSIKDQSCKRIRTTCYSVSEDIMWHYFVTLMRRIWKLKPIKTLIKTTISTLSLELLGSGEEIWETRIQPTDNAEKYKNELPLATESVMKSACMDDSMVSVSEEIQGVELYEQLDNLWFKVGMHARKMVVKFGQDSWKDTDRRQGFISSPRQRWTSRGKNSWRYVVVGRRQIIQGKSSRERL